MKKSVGAAAFVVLFASQLFATYIVVTKDGTHYKAKSKPTIVNGKALIRLESGSVVTLNPNEIDVAKSEEVTQLGLGNVSILGTEPQKETAAQKAAPSLGQLVRGVRRSDNSRPTPVAPAEPQSGTAPVAPAAIPDQLDGRLKDNFERAYENVGIFEHKLTGTNRNVRVQLTADNEDKVFNAISATAFLIIRNAGLEKTQIDTVELFMQTTTGGSAGRFQMNRADADAINGKSISLSDYFVRKVIY
ncbi:MAG TPA: hypothetical protein VLU46_10755 [Thermoanaerobaculia bacterium]|nr:hypothetical protein [Thermoanaerobaculia bacterium]